MTNIDTNQMDNQINPQDLALEEQKVSGEVGLDTAEDNQLADFFNSEEEEFEDFADKQALEFEVNDFGKLLRRSEAGNKTFIKDLKESAKELKQQAYSLNKLPEKTGEHLLSLIPEISEALHKRVLEDFDHQLELRSVKMTEMFQRLEERHSSIAQSLNASHTKQLENLNVLNTRFQEVENILLKRKILSYVTSTLFLIGVALSACWTTFKYFPSKVLINEGNSVTVQGSDVTVWSKDYKILDKVTNKEGSRPSKR